MGRCICRWRGTWNSPLPKIFVCFLCFLWCVCPTSSSIILILPKWRHKCACWSQIQPCPCIWLHNAWVRGTHRCMKVSCFSLQINRGEEGLRNHCTHYLKWKNLLKVLRKRPFPDRRVVFRVLSSSSFQHQCLGEQGFGQGGFLRLLGLITHSLEAKAVWHAGKLLPLCRHGWSGPGTLLVPSPSNNKPTPAIPLLDWCLVPTAAWGGADRRAGVRFILISFC